MAAGLYLTIRQAGAALRAGTLTSTALTEAVLARIEATEPAVNAYITVTADLAREQAATADAELAAGRDRGPLHGIPFALKDLFDTAGIPTTAGSGFLRDRVPSEDAFVVKRLHAAGVVLTGKLGLHEFAFGTTSTNEHFGPIRNPWNLDHVPGGSSGGSGAAVAAGSCLGTLGTDTGGSIRMPAALCGVTGLMPSTGRVSRSGVFPLSQTLDHAGPLARTVEDCALILNAIAGHDPDDPLSVDRPVPDYTRELGRDLRGLRVGVPRDPLWLGVDDEVAAACETALDVLRHLGATVEVVALPLMAKTGRLRISASEAAAFHREWLRQHLERYGEDVRSKIESGVPVLATEYIEDQQRLRALTEETRQVLATVDVLVSPTTPTTAPTIEAGDPDSRLARYTRMYNITGIPAASIPCGFDARGLPIGLMVGGRHFDEVTVCRVAHAYEQATDWHTRRAQLPPDAAGGNP
jgi:aspartyl-tRNA(Asn)/glutamyl-tRNA(Gln) amidotransferase subunit A